MKYSGVFSLLLLALVVFASDMALAQRNATTYQHLLARTRQANVYLDAAYVPGNADLPSVAVHFRIEHDFLTFTKSAAGDSAEFASNVTVFIDVYPRGTQVAEQAERPDPAAARRQNPGNNTRGATPSSTALHSEVWTGTAFAANYAQTISNRHYLEGGVYFAMPAGQYDVVMSLRQDQQTRDRVIARAPLRIAAAPSPSSIPVLAATGESFSGDGITLSGFGSNVPYGSDITLLVPASDSLNNARISIRALNINRRDTTAGNELFSGSIDANKAVSLVLGDKPYQLKTSNDGLRWIPVLIPSGSFPNTPFSLEITPQNGSKPIIRKVYQSKWVDIPTSLLNVSVAIDMMEVILEKDEYRRVRRLNAQEKEKFFNDFWQPKDPSPGTEYNELMVEYFRRVDIAYERYSSATTPGYATDQGKTFLLMGEPDSVTRRFPPDQPTIEIWKYGERELIFQATSGFGDFQLIQSGG